MMMMMMMMMIDAYGKGAGHLCSLDYYLGAGRRWSDMLLVVV